MTGTVAAAAPPTGFAAAPAQEVVPAPLTGTMAAAATASAASPGSPGGTVGAQIPVTGTVAESNNQSMPAAVVPTQKKKYANKSFHPVRDDNEPGPSQEQEKEAQPEIITQSLSLGEL